MTNHNVKTCRKKKKQTMVATIKAAQPSPKTQKTSSYACHIYGLNGHKMTDWLKIVEMQKMFHGKSMTIAQVQPITKTQTIIMDVNVADVNVTTSKVTEKHVFEDRKLRKAMNVVD